MLSLADGAVLFAAAAFFRQVALRAMGLTLHGGLSGKLYLSMGGWGKAKVGMYTESFTCSIAPSLPSAEMRRSLCS
jgi:hypothetical protein